MEIQVFNTAQEAAMALSDLVIARIKTKTDLRLGVATGRTMDAVYYHLVNQVRKNQINCHQMKFFALDEYIGLNLQDEHTFAHYLNHHLYQPLGVRIENTFIPDTQTDNYDEKSELYESQISSLGGIDLQLMGVGVNGHIGLNEPGSAFDSKTRVVALTSSSRSANQSAFKNSPVPLTALTMGIGTILSARECVLIATGESKAQVIAKIVKDEASTSVPASSLKYHNNAKLILDKAAAKLI
jgi:glucosamine-6-phosphate deaminase